MRRNIAALMLGLALAFSGCAWADGYPDQPIRKSVRKVTVPRPAKRKKAAVKKAPAPKPAAKPVVTALQQGVALAEQERYGAAQPLLRKAIMENRRSAAAWYWYGVCHEKTGRFYEAQYFYTKAVECDPNFEPLSRVVAWPGNGEKTPVWDPKRPARVYPVSIAGKNATIIPPGSPQSRVRPSRPATELPKVPVYTPPEPGASPMDGDAWHPSVYVPPTMSEARLESEEGDYPAYIPPASPKGLYAETEPAMGSGPAYQPPSQPASVAAPGTVRSAAYQPPDRPKAAAQRVQAERQEEVKPAAPRKIVKQSAKKPSKKPAKKPDKKPDTKPDAKPEVTTQPKGQTPKQTAPVREQRSQGGELPPPEPIQLQPESPRQLRVEELPPVGQGMPAGTVEAPALPPVGQGGN